MAKQYVEATAVGFYGGLLRQVGDGFYIEKAEEFSKVWMEKAKKPRKTKAKDEPEAEEEAAEEEAEEK